MYGCDRDSARALVELVDLKRVILPLGTGKDDFMKGLLHVSDSIRCEPDIHASVDGNINATDFDGGAEAAVDLYSWEIVFLQRVGVE